MPAKNKWFALTAALGALVLVEGESLAAPKDECVDAHSRAQDLRERGQLVKARQTFLSCAQSSCPTLVQADCARFGEEVDRILPSVTFSARDSAGSDLSNTAVYVDEALVASRLDEGKSFDMDPGRHVVRFLHEGKETVLRMVLNQGEKGRLVLATFSENENPRKNTDAAVDTSPKRSRSVFPLVLAGLGTAAAATGGVMFAAGMGKVPENCSFSSRECAGPPNDPTLTEAKNGASLANVGLGIGIGGAVVLATSLVWYFAQPYSSGESKQALAQPGFTF